MFTRRNRPTLTQIYSKNSPESDTFSKLPEIRTPHSRKQDQVKEAVIAGVYRSMGVFNGTIKEKGKIYSELMKYLLDHGHIKPIMFYQKRWSSRNLTLEEAIAFLKPHFDSILVKSESQLTLTQQRMQSEYKRFSTLVPIGESGDNGWEHSDIYEIKGENGVESYYCISQNPKRLPKLRNKSTDFLCVSFDEYLQMKNRSDNN